ncbi:maleylpyruvate isomerase N-terminal domain-containing protein [Mycolicibacterium komossense]|uniref:Maleylpyruvate isomerase N-terminal domain-containing protein n=1 Tax=Mycolicibacterium komossense TaxID=1779 RepID=A0ABT3CAI7_9MYCO|nr:maleylpyruvate isomerase N-terminal domain-containing protein [Mycolicibacterium komossense]MCV7226494.1 maleylpyruvate isomerase N-terminal domain-containing protein [Mycolicibacterium komossense]
MIVRAQPNRTAALRAERDEILRLCSDLSCQEWTARSAAEGWRVQDVVAHLGSGCHSLFTPSAVTMLLSKDIEHTNDTMVAARRSWEPDRVLQEYSRWSARVTRLSGAVATTPLSRLRIRLAELGSFPIGLLLGAAMVFDHHTHLRFDIAPAIGRETPPTDANRMSVVIEWMLAVLSNQLRQAPLEWMRRPVSLELTGLGGGFWSIAADGTVTAGLAQVHRAADIVATTEEFPEWATRRARWQDRNITIGGDHDYGERFLNVVNIV